jgi:glycosyltransferase involved in cell wall biosynthesis
MKVALVARTIRRKGGTESYLFDLVGGLREAGHDVDLFTVGEGRDSPARAAGARVHRIRLGALPNVPRLWLFRAALAWTLARADYDLSISLSRLNGLDLAICGGTHLGYLRAAKRRLRLRDRCEIALERRCYAESSVMIAHSQLMQRELVELYGLSPGKIHVIHPPVNVRQFHPGAPGAKALLKRRLGLAEDKTTLLFPSTSHERKGLPLLLEALDILPAGRFELVVAGSNSGLLRGRADVKFLGFINDLADVYRAADLTVLPSHYEPFGLVITESIACGTPVVTHRRVGACDLVTEREGVVFDELNSAALAEAIQQASGRQFEIADDFCLSHGLTIERHVERLLAARQLMKAEQG